MSRFLTAVGVIIFVFITTAFADGKTTAKRLCLNAGDKAAKQWERILTSPERLREIGADKLTDSERNALKSYLMAHAADSDHPSVPGN